MLEITRRTLIERVFFTPSLTLLLFITREVNLFRQPLLNVELLHFYSLIGR